MDLSLSLSLSLLFIDESYYELQEVKHETTVYTNKKGNGGERRGEQDEEARER